MTNELDQNEGLGFRVRALMFAGYVGALISSFFFTDAVSRSALEVGRELNWYVVMEWASEPDPFWICAAFVFFVTVAAIIVGCLSPLFWNKTSD